MGENKGENQPTSQKTTESLMVRVYGSSNRIGFNPGHTDELRKTYPWINNVSDQTNLPPALMSLDVEKLGKELLAHQEDSPFAVVDVTTLIKEELINKLNPNTLIQDLKSDDVKVKELRESDEFSDDLSDYEEDLDQTGQLLRDCLVINPSQIKAVRGLLNNENFTLAVKIFLEKHGDNERFSHGIPIGKTQGKYLEEVLASIATLLNTMNGQLFNCVPRLQENEELLQDYDISIPEKKD